MDRPLTAGSRMRSCGGRPAPHAGTRGCADADMRALQAPSSSLAPTPPPSGQAQPQAPPAQVRPNPDAPARAYMQRMARAAALTCAVAAPVAACMLQRTGTGQRPRGRALPACVTDMRAACLCARRAAAVTAVAATAAAAGPAAALAREARRSRAAAAAALAREARRNRAAAAAAAAAPVAGLAGRASPAAPAAHLAAPAATPAGLAGLARAEARQVAAAATAGLARAEAQAARRVGILQHDFNKQPAAGRPARCPLFSYDKNAQHVLGWNRTYCGVHSW